MPHAHLLVVDDEPSILTTLQKALTLEGYSVDVAGGVKVADEKLKKRSYDLCLFDVQLPDGDGTRSARADPRREERGARHHDERARDDRHRGEGDAPRRDELPREAASTRTRCSSPSRPRSASQRAESEARELRAASGTDRRARRREPAIKKLVEQIARAAKSSASVLVTGERGTGKELVARAIHLALAAREGSAREAELRRAAERADRERAVRPRGRRVHRRDEAAPRQVRARERRHALPRRGRRHAAADAGEAPARPAGARDRARRRQRDASRSTRASSPRPIAIS